MADMKKDIETSQDESDVDRINTFVTSSEDEISKGKSEKEQKYVEEKSEKAEEDDVEDDTKNSKKEDKTHKETAPVHHKKHVAAHPKVHAEKHSEKPEDKKEVKNDVKKKEHTVHTDTKTAHKADHKHTLPVHHKKVEVKKQEKRVVKSEIKKSGEATNMKKNKPSKNNEKKHKKAFKFTKNTLMWIGIGVLAAILVIALVLVFSPKIGGTTAKNQTINTVAATVNGEAIYLQDIQKEFDSLNPMIQQMYTLESILNQSIDNALLKQEAKAKDITITKTEIQAEIDAVKEENGLTQEQFEDAIQKQGMTLKTVETMINDNLLIKKFLNNTILKDLAITENNIKAYYDLNVEKFVAPEQVTVQHILVMVTSNVTDEQAKSKIEQIKTELTDTNFCELVTEYSEDGGSVNDCGTYTFPRGYFNNPDFENPSFSLQIGETAIVKTTFGYHLIKKLESMPARTLNLSEVRDKINTTLYDETAQKRFDTLMSELRDKAIIVNYFTKTESNNTILVPLETESLESFAKCLTEKGAKFYGASWCSHCNNQKKSFGDALEYLTYIECAVEGEPQVQTEACDEAGIEGYPTWVINGKQYPGEQSFAKLAQLSGCTAPQ